MGEVPSNSDPTLPPRTSESEATRVDVPREPATIVTPHQPRAGAVPHEPATDAPRPEPATDAPRPEPATDVPRPEPPTDGPRSQPPVSEVVRYGPGVPASQAEVAASQAEVAAESVWRTGRRPEPPPRKPGLRRLRRLLGPALTVILLGAAAILLYLRFFDHPSLHVTGVGGLQQTRTGCTVDVTGRIDTNGATGTVSYQWVFRPQTQAPQPLNQSVVAGQHAVYVTVAVEGQGHGTASKLITLDVLGPGTGTASTTVTISC
jgi:hypothetical protein